MNHSERIHTIISGKPADRTGFWLGNASLQEVMAEVCRLGELLGPCWIASPSHEAILPDVPPLNIAAMAEATIEA